MNVGQIWASRENPISLVALQPASRPDTHIQYTCWGFLKSLWFFCPLNNRLLTWLENPLMPHLLFWHEDMRPRILYGGAPAHQQLWCPPKAAGKGLSAQRTQINGKSAQQDQDAGDCEATAPPWAGHLRPFMFVWSHSGSVFIRSKTENCTFHIKHTDFSV